MSHNIDRLVTELFPQDGPQARNVKFFVGNNRDVTASDLAEQFLRASAQVRTGNAVVIESLDSDLLGSA